MKKTFFRLIFTSFLALTSNLSANTSAAIDLSGKYQLELQPTGTIIIPKAEKEISIKSLKFDDTITLPNSTDLAKKGTHITEATPHEFHLDREYEHLGPAYYKRKISIPNDWKNKEIEIFLERVMWQSRVWIDGKAISSPQDSLSTPHIHHLGKLTPGEHELIICVDNRMIYPTGDKSHAYGAQTQSLWNGVIGKMEIRPVSAIAQVRVFPKNDGTVKIEVTGNLTGTLTASIGDISTSTEIKNSSKETLSLKVKKPVLWSEFTPKTYEVKIQLKGSENHTKTETFGFRSTSREGNQLFFNGKPAFMRGNLECAVFPKTGHPPVTVDEWARIWDIYKKHNLNHARFHSWCPPEAAFIAADKAGIYLQVEAPIWVDSWMIHPNKRRPEMDTLGNPKGLGKNNPIVDQFVQTEIRRTLDTYGNHPSFVFFCIGNELGTSDFDVLAKWIKTAKTYDTRHLYAASTARKLTKYCDFSATLAIPGTSGRCRQHVEFGTHWDYEKKYSRSSMPTIVHEIGQWPVYVDWEKELPKYNGPLKPYHLELKAQQAKKNGLYSRAAEFKRASGASNNQLYRYEIESFLRTPSCRGFQLLGMQDFTGQGEALIGWLDPFYDSKGITKAEDFRRYCAPTVALLKLPGYAYKASDKPQISALVHHFGANPIDTQASWKLTNKSGSIIDSGKLNSKSIPVGSVQDIGTFSLDFSKVKSASKLSLTIELPQQKISNSYSIWVYPELQKEQTSDTHLITSDWEEAKKALAAGKNVLLDAHSLGAKKSASLAHWMPLYWSGTFFPGQNRKTIGLLVHHKHAAFDQFPTQDYGAWNWYRICRGAHGFDLTDITTSDYRGITEPVHDFHFNRRLGSIFEFKYGKGKLLVCGYNITDSEALEFPEVAQLRHSLVSYVASEQFTPSTEIKEKALDKLFENVDLKLQKLPKRFTDADLYINAAGQLSSFKAITPWKKNLDQVLRESKGTNYSVKSDGIWRDKQGSAWIGKEITVDITPRSGVPGTLYVRFHDWDNQGRTGTVTLDGKPQNLDSHTKGVWLEFPVIREDTNDAQLIFKAKTLTGKNLMITDLTFISSE